MGDWVIGFAKLATDGHGFTRILGLEFFRGEANGIDPQPVRGLRIDHGGGPPCHIRRTPCHICRRHAMFAVHSRLSQLFCCGDILGAVDACGSWGCGGKCGDGYEARCGGDGWGAGGDGVREFFGAGGVGRGGVGGGQASAASYWGEFVGGDDAVVGGAGGEHGGDDGAVSAEVWARFYDPVADRLETFEFEFEAVAGSMGEVGGSPSYQVVREEFDAMLAGKAREAGCAVWEGAMIESFEEEAERPTVRLRDGRELSCRMLVDATGRQPLLAVKRKTRKMIREYGRVGIYNYFAELPPHDGEDAKFITMYLFDGGWVWLIPLRGGKTSVGVVYRDVPEVAAREGEGGESRSEALFWHAVKGMPRLERRLRAARAMEEFRAIADYSYTVDEKYGERFVAVGDAAGFLDPIFSSGVHLALSSARAGECGDCGEIADGVGCGAAGLCGVYGSGVPCVSARLCIDFIIGSWCGTCFSWRTSRR